MKRIIFLLPVIALLAISSNSIFAQNKSTAAFEKLKSLNGEWQGRGEGDRQVDVSYQIVSGGSVLLETLQGTNEPPMVTLYHTDGDRLMMTHYCSIGNQPRMAAQAPAGEIKDINFTFVDITNLTNPSAGHMRGLVFTFQDKDHIRQEWTWRMDGKDEKTIFNLERKK